MNSRKWVVPRTISDIWQLCGWKLANNNLALEKEMRQNLWVDGSGDILQWMIHICTVPHLHVNLVQPVAPLVLNPCSSLYYWVSLWYRTKLSVTFADLRQWSSDMFLWAKSPFNMWQVTLSVHYISLQKILHAKWVTNGVCRVTVVKSFV